MAGPKMRCRAGHALGLLVLAMVDTQSTAATPLARPPAVRATAGQLFAMAEELLRRGQAQQAEALLDLLGRDPDIKVRAEARFRQAMLIAANGREREAAVLLRQILDERPDAVPARLQLASMLQKMGDEQAALRELRALRSADLPANVARFVDRVSASLQASKPLGFHLEVALAPDSNINRATRSDTLGTVFGDFTLDQKTKSGVGAAVRGLAQARLPLSGELNLVGRLSGDGNLYRDKDFNDIALDLAVGPEFRLGKARISAEAAAGQQWFGMKPYQRGLRISGSVSHPVSPVSQARLDLGARWTDNRLNDLQDGNGVTGRLRYEHALSPTTLVSASIGGDRFKAKDGAYSTTSWNAGLAAYREIGRMTVNAGVEFGRLKADERLALLPEAREDRLTRFHLGAVFRQLTVAGFAPMTRLVVERNRSTVEFHDYKRTRTEFGISRAF